MKSSVGVLLLLVGFSQAIQVYLSPPVPLPSLLSPGQASFAISRHLGLEFFEPVDLYGESSHQRLFDDPQFVGRGASNAVLLSIHDTVIKDVLPPNWQPSFSLPSTYTVSSLSSLISTYLHRARHAYASIYAPFVQPTSPPRFLDIFSVSSPSTDSFISELSVLSDFIDAPSNAEKFAALELKGLSDIAQHYGQTSDQYKIAARATRAMLESVMAHPSLHLVLLTFIPEEESDDRLHKRESEPPGQTHLPVPSPLPQQPISGVSTCFATKDACSNSTMSCSGRGQCVEASKAGRTCFICSCVTTTNEKGHKETWVGDACERKDISVPFTLISGTVIGFILLVGAAVSLMASAGNQELPSVLLAGASGAERRD